MSFTPTRIDELIACEKRIIESPSREFREENRHRRKDMRLQSIGEQHLFVAFIRQSLEFAEDFSFGLIYLSTQGRRITLVRYNGQHDQSNDPFDQAKAHFQYHIHKATAEDLNNADIISIQQRLPKSMPRLRKLLSLSLRGYVFVPVMSRCIFPAWRTCRSSANWTLSHELC